MYPQQPPKNPALAAILSFIISGLGQIYNGEVTKGVIIIVVQILNAASMAIIIGFVTWPIIWIWSMYDAYKVAQRINAEAAQQVVQMMKVCPRCAERVNSGAVLCHYCGYQFMPDAQQLAAPVAAYPMQAPPVPAWPVAASTPSAFPPAQAVSSGRSCASCGRQVSATARFCASCGSPLP